MSEWNEEYTHALLLYLQERGYDAGLCDNQWQISIKMLHSNPIICVFDDEVEVHLNAAPVYVDIAKPDCFDRVEKLIQEDDFALSTLYPAYPA